MPSADPITQRQVLNQVNKHKTICANIKYAGESGSWKRDRASAIPIITVSVFPTKPPKQINSIIISIDVKKKKKESIK